MNLQKVKWEGFTILELLIIFLIIGMMTAVALPIYQANLTRAKEVEAESTLNTIRTFLKIHHAIHETYPVCQNYVNVTELPELNISPEELDGQYYHADCYIYKSVNGEDYILQSCHEGNPSFQMNSTGLLTKIGNNSSHSRD